MSLFGVGFGSNWASSNGAPVASLASTNVKLTGITSPVPLFYASPAQVNFQMPFEAQASTIRATV